MNQRQFIAFDLGAESGRSVLGTLVDGKIRLEETHRFANPTGRLNQTLCWNVLEQWEQIKLGLRRSIDKADGPIAGVGVDTWGVDFGLLAADDSLLGLPVMYRDSRTDGMMDRAFASVPAEEIFRITGIQFMQLNTLFQLLAMSQAKSSLLASASKLLFMPDLFHWLLSGVGVNEYSIASTSQLLDATSGKWSIDLISRLGLPHEIFGQIVPSGTVLGDIRKSLREELKIERSEMIPVITPGSHDTASAVAAVPAQGGGWCYISSGTWSLMGVELDQPLINAQSRAYNYTNEGGVGGKIRFLRNIMGLWLVQECRRAFKAAGHDHSYAELTAMAAREQPYRSLINPDWPPMLKPGDMPAKIEQFCKRTHQPVPTTRGEYVRACLDSLALTYRRTLQGLENLLERSLQTIHVVGGGCQNELLNQLTADACGRTVVAGPVEATALGNILTQAIAVGVVRDLAHARQIIADSLEMRMFHPQKSPLHDQAAAKFEQILTLDLA